MDPTIDSKPLSEIEEGFLARVEETPLPIHDLMALLKAVGADPERREAAASWAELLHDRLKKERMLADGVALAELRASWLDGKADAEIRAACDAWLTDLFSRESVGRNFIPGAGFREVVPTADCFRRLRLLMALKPGAFCVHPSWGAGTVRRLDDFYAKVEVDFAGHPRHELSYAFVAESLQLPPDDHLLVRQALDPEGLQSLVRDDPAEVVRIALRSFGPMPLARLQETLSPAIVPAEGWKPFWDTARKALIAAGDGAIPSRKLEPIHLVDAAATPAARWTERLRGERRLERLTALFEELAQDRDRPTDDPAFDQLVREKIAAVRAGAKGSKEELVVRTVLAGQAMGIALDAADGDALRRRWMEPDGLGRLLNELPVRLVQPFLQFVTADRQQGIETLLDRILELHLSPQAETIAFLRGSPAEARLITRLRELAFGRKENILLLFWMARNLDLVRDWELVPLPDLPFRVIEMLRGVFMYEALRAANGLRALLDDKAWLQETVGRMDPVRRSDFLRLVREPDAPMYFDAQSLLGRLIALFPELAAAFQTEELRPSSGLTSWRTYLQRQRQLERLVTVEIPRNAREIEIARGYGDLRENHEYKAAKETQALLLRRKEELQRDLQSVKGTDFVRFPTDAAGMGVQVDIEREGGVRETYAILGEWDQDEALGIISCQSGLGKRLFGLKPGETLSVPDAEGRETPARLVAVRPLPPELVQWARITDAL